MHLLLCAFVCLETLGTLLDTTVESIGCFRAVQTVAVSCRGNDKTSRTSNFVIAHSETFAALHVGLAALRFV
jgi:hypothetical protein